jgi:hypothetical protein
MSRFPGEVRFWAGFVTLLSCAVPACRAAELPDLTDRRQILAAARAPVSVEQQSAAAALARQARERATSDERRLGRIDWGPLAKLWCEAAAMRPTPENLQHCARARVGAARQGSNPQPSADAALADVSNRSLAMVEAARELSEADGPDGLARQLGGEEACLRALGSRAEPPEGCPAPYRSAASQ